MLYYSHQTREPRNEDEAEIRQALLEHLDNAENGIGSHSRRREPVFWSCLRMAFAKVHRERMLTEANRYADAFARLEWIHVGRIAFTVRKKATDREVIALSDDKNHFNALLDRMFGLPNTGDLQ